MSTYCPLSLLRINPGPAQHSRLSHLVLCDVINNHHCITALQVIGRHLQASDMATHVPQLQHSRGSVRHGLAAGAAAG